MLLKAALALLGLLGSASAWNIASVELNYVSGTLPDEDIAGLLTARTVGRLVNPTVWHDTVTTPLVLQLVLTRGITTEANLASLANLATPANTWLKVTSRDSPTTLASAVTVSQPITYSAWDTNTKLRYNLTFSGAYGGYNLTFDVAALLDTNNAAGSYASSAPSVGYGSGAVGIFTAGYVQVLAGYAPSVSIVNGASTVTSTWLDPSNTNNVLSITSGSTSVGLATAGGITAPASPCVTADGSSATAVCPKTASATPALSFSSLTYTASSATYNLSAAGGSYTTPSTWNTGAFVLPVAAGLFQRADGVYNFKASITVKVGWRPQVSFVDTLNYYGQDTSSFATIGGGVVPADYWFNAALSSLELWVNPSASASSAEETLDFAGSGSPLTLDALLGVTAATRPGAAARAGGIQSSASSYAVPASSNAAARRFPLTITGLPPGTYSLTIPAGTLKSGNATGAMNCAVTAVLKIGFVPRVQVLDASGRDATTSWLDASGTFSTYTLNLLPTTGYTLAANTSYVGPAASAVFDAMPNVAGATTPASVFSTAGAGLYTAASASFALSNLRPTAALPINVSASAVKRGDGIMSTFTVATLTVGFTPAMAFADASGRASTFKAFGSNSLLTTSYTLPLGSGITPATPPTGAYFFSPRQTVRLSLQDPSGTVITSAAQPVTTNGGLFAGISIAGFPAPAQVFSAPVFGASGFANYSLSLASTAPGVYGFPVASGAVCGAGGICNAPSIIQLFVGYDIQPRLASTFSSSPTGAQASPAYFEYLPDGTPVEPGLWSLDLAPGPGFYFATSAAATAPANYIDTAGPAANVGGTAHSLFPTACAATFVSSTSAPSQNPFQYTYANTYSGINYISISAPAACTATGDGPYGTYLARIKSGSLQRDDGVFNADFEYPVTLGFPVTATVMQLNAGGTAVEAASDGANLSPAYTGTYILQITPGTTVYVPATFGPYVAAVGTPGVTTATAVSGYTLDAAPAYSLSGLFARQAALPAGSAISGSVSTVVTASALNYALAFTSASAAYGAYPVRISAGSITATKGGKTYACATSWSFFKIGFNPKLSIVNAAGADVTTTFWRPSAAADIAQTEALFLRLTIPDPALAQQLALQDFSGIPFTTAVKPYVTLGATTPFDLSGMAPKYASGPALRTTASGLTLDYKIADSTNTNGGTGVGGAFTAYNLVKDSGGLHRVTVPMGTFCTTGSDVCNAATTLTLTTNAVYITAAGAATVTGSALPAATSNTFLGGWIKPATPGAAAEVFSSYPTGTWASTVYVLFTFDSAHGYTAAAPPTITTSTTGPTVAVDASSTATTLVLAVGLASAPQGACDITIAPSTGGTTFAPSSVRVIKGFQARAFDVSSAPAPLPRRGEALVLSASDVSLAFLGLAYVGSGQSFGTVLTSAVDGSGRDVSGIITCAGSTSNIPTPCSSALPGGGLAYPQTLVRGDGLYYYTYRVGFGGLSDGSYTLGLTADAALVSDTNGIAPTANATFKLIVDRTPPVAKATVATLTVSGNTPNQSLPIPAGMFADAISPASALTITLLAPVPAGWALYDSATSGISPTGRYPNVALVAGAATPVPSDTPVLFTLQATDEAGNTATAQLSLTLAAPIAASLTVQDARGTSGTPLSALVTAPAADGSVTLTVNAVFTSAVGPLLPSSLSCRTGSFGNTAMQLSAGPCEGATVTVTPGDGVTKSRKFVFTVVLPAAAVARVANVSLATGFQFSLNATAAAPVTSATGVAAGSALPVFAFIDSAPPRFGQGVSTAWCYGATLGVFYSQLLPLNLFSDAFTAPGKILVTAASPATQYGLTFTPGVLGLGAKLTGKPTSLPPNGRATFDLTVVDAAGNSKTFTAALGVPILAAPDAGIPTITMKSTPLTWTKPLGSSISATTTATLVDGSASIAGVGSSLVSSVATAGYAAQGSAGQIFVQLQSPDTPSTPCGFFTGTAAECTEYVYSTAFPLISAVPNPAITTSLQQLYFDVDSGCTEAIYTPTSTTLTQAQINQFLSTLTYVNKGTNVTSGPRTVTVSVLGFSNGNVVASASRVINVVTANNLPVITAGAATTVATYGAQALASGASTQVAAGAGTTAGSPSDVLLFGASSLSGTAAPTFADGDDTAASAVSVVITACDAARDVLYVGDRPGTFTDRQIAVAKNTWGLRRSVYGTWTPSTCTLSIKPIAGFSAPLAAFQAALAAVYFTSKDLNNPTGFAAPATATAAVLVAARAFTVTVSDAAAGGRAAAAATSLPLSGTFSISSANRDAVINKRLAYTTFLSSKLPLANAYRGYVDAAGTIPFSKMFIDNSASTAILTIALGVSTTPGVFAGGAITDADTASITTPTVSYTGASSLVVVSSFSASTGVLTVSLSGFAGLSGEQTLNFNWPSALVGGLATVASITLPFQVDFRTPGCTLSNAANYVGDGALASALPANGGCTFAPVTVAAVAAVPGMPTPTPVAVPVGGYAAANGVLSAAAAQLASLNVPVAQQITALAAQRAAARGASSVFIPPSAIVGAGSIAVTAALPSAATTALLKAIPGAPSDQSLSLLLGPAGTQFSAPVQVCMYVGDTPSGSYQALYVASQLSAADISKGFGPLSVLSDQVFNAATGQLCGSTTHFSAFVPIPLPLPTVPLVPKSSGVGGACPNQCSGQGFCRKEGKCACFPGYVGYDCSARACPSGASWGQGSGAGAGISATAIGGDAATVTGSVHTDAECSGRGVCDRAKAACACFPGYEGPACQRIACPNACSGHGKCRFLSELPQAALGGVAVSAWEAQRVQKCLCDGGYSGADCSQRTCPYGDDPETICSDTTRQVQRVSLYYGAGPGAAASLPTGAAADFSTSALALTFQAPDGAVYTTPAVTSVWGTDAATGAAAAASVATALLSLPRGAISGVAVTGDVTTNAAASRTFDVTFTGPTNTGNQALLGCAWNSDGYSLGCSTPGCRPLFAQPRLLNVLSTVSLTGSVSVSSGAVLLQPAGVSGGGTNATAGAWGVETTLTLTASTYSWGSTKVYGSATGAEEPVTPLPPAVLRTGIAGPYGLLVDLGSDLSSLFTASATVSVTFKWRLPVCAVTQTQAAAADYENAECSNRGVCDRTAGKCLCFMGYSGSACNAQIMYV